MLGADTSSASHSWRWLTRSFDATSTRIENSTAFRSSGPRCFWKLFFSSIDARLAA